MPVRTFPKKFDVLDERWYPCVLCGTTSSAPEVAEGEDDADDISGGCMYPESRLNVRDGKRYCASHFRFRFYKIDLDDQDVNARELDE